MKVSEVVEQVHAFHGTRSDAIVGELKPSTNGRFGPGVYASLQPGVAGVYGRTHKVVIRANLFDAFPRFLMSDERVRVRQQMFGLMTEPEQMRVAEWWSESKGLITGEDIWEIFSRRLGPERTHQILKQMGYEGITGIGDGQEICVFDPRNIQLVPSG